MEELIRNNSVNFSREVTAVLMTDEILISFGILMLIENFISIIILWRCTRLLFQIKILSLHLAMSDFLTGFFLAFPNTLLYEKTHCDLKKYPGYLFINVSLLIVTMMNLDRCLVFAFAMRYYSFITKKFINGMCLLAWLLGLFLTYGMFYGSDAGFGFSCELMAYSSKNAVNTTFRCVILGIVVINVGFFGYLLIKIRKRLRQIQSEKTRNSVKTQHRIVRKILPIIALFLAAFFPFMTIFTFPIFNETSKLWKNMYTCMASMVLLNSACNPVFYVWRFSEPRYHMKRLLCFWNKDMVEHIDRKYNRQTASYDMQAVYTLTE